MDISSIISANLTRWMSTTPGLDTLKKVSIRSGVGFGTVQRAANGTGNITTETLEALASAFGYSPIELITPRDASEPGPPQPNTLEIRYAQADNATRTLIDIALSGPSDPLPLGLTPSLRVLVEMARTAIRDELDRSKSSP